MRAKSFWKQKNKGKGKLNTKICAELFSYLSDNISGRKRSFKHNSCTIGFDHLSNVYDRELCNNSYQVLTASHCCIALYHRCLLDSLVHLCIFNRLNQKSFFTIRKFSAIRRLFRKYRNFSESKGVFTN